MELKSYQKEVIANLARYLELVVELQSRQRRIRPSGTKRMFWWASAVCRIM